MNNEKFVLSTIEEADSTYSSVCLSFKDGTKRLVFRKNKKIDIYFYGDKEQPEVIYQTSIGFTEPIQCIQGFKQSNNGSFSQGLLILSDYVLYSVIIEGHEADFPLQEIVRLETSNQQPSMDFSEMLISKTIDDITYVLIHCFNGFISFISIPSPSRSKKDPKRRKRIHRANSEELFQQDVHFKTISIGNVALASMEFLQDTDDRIIAALYRDFNYNYSLRYYAINYEDLNLSLCKQFREFEEPPTCMISPTYGGLLVFSPLHFFYFSNPGVRASSTKDELIIHSEFDTSIVTKEIDESTQGKIMYGMIKCATNIDPHRVILIGENGIAYIFFMEYNFLKRNIQFHSLEIFPLVETTVANDVHFLGKGVFLASSRYSQSIVFEVLSSLPYVEIIRYMPSSPPVLDLIVSKSSPKNDVYTCQSGPFSSEFRRYSRSKMKMKVIAKKETKKAIISMRKSISTNCVNLLDFEQQLLTYLSCDLGSIKAFFFSDDDLAMSINDDNIISKPHNFAVKVSPEIFVCVEESNILINHDLKVLHVIPLEFDTVTSMNAVKDIAGDIIILISSLCGLSVGFKVKINNVTHKQLFIIEDRKYSIISSCIFLDEHNNISIILSKTNGDIEHFEFKTSEGKIQKEGNLLSGHPTPLRILSYEDNTALLYSEDELFILTKNKSNLFSLSRILHSIKSIYDIIHVTNGYFLILSRGFLYFTQVTDRFVPFDYDVIFANSTFIKCLELDPMSYIVVLSIEDIFMGLKEGSKKQYCLRLIDKHTMMIIDVHRFSNDFAYEILDLCPCHEVLDEISFFALNNSGEVAECLIPFVIKDSSLFQLPPILVRGLKNSDMITRSKLFQLPSAPYKVALGGNFFFILELYEIEDDSEVKYEFRLIEGSMKSVMGSITDIFCTESLIFFTDIIGSLSVVPIEFDQEKMYISELPTKLNSTFISCFTAIELCENKSIVILCDVLGNISALEYNSQSKKADDIFLYNIGEQINTIKAVQTYKVQGLGASEENSLKKYFAVAGTVDGGVYGISYVDGNKNSKFFEIIEECSKELILQENLNIGGQNSSKYDDWISSKDARIFGSKFASKTSRTENFGLQEVSLMQRWVKLESELDLSKSSNKRLQRKMKDLLPICYREKQTIIEFLSSISIT